MRFTLSRLVWIVGAIAAAFLAFYILGNYKHGTGKLRYGVADIWNSARFYTGYLWNVRRGAWRKKLELGVEDYQRLEYYCEGPKLHLPRNQKERVLGAQMLIRHGDRGALFTVKDSPSDCPYEEQHSLPEEFLSYYTQASSYKKSKEEDFHFIPERSGCLNGQLTSKGVIQHLELGAAVAKRLGKDGRAWISDDTPVYSTFYPRTYQSAMAFMQGLDPVHRSLPRNIHLTPAGDHMFCSVAKTCACQGGRNLSHQFIKVKTDLLQQDAHRLALVARLRDVLASHIEDPLKEWPAHVFDILLQFACHGKRMPCLDGTCVSYSELLDVIHLLESLAADLTHHQVVKDLSVSDAYGLLQVMTDNLAKVVKGKDDVEDKDRFTLFSAHDSTIVPLMHSLGLPFHIVIPYASYVLFELYTDESNGDSSENVYLRIIYNNEDVTSRVSCYSQQKSSTEQKFPFALFKEFVDSDLKSRYKKVCDS